MMAQYHNDLEMDIERAKQRLRKKYDAVGLYENFGRSEVRKLWSKYGMDDNFKNATALIGNFDAWCMDFTGK